MMAESQRKTSTEYLPERVIKLEYLDQDRAVVTAKDKGQTHIVELFTEKHIGELHRKLNSRIDIAYVMCGISIFIAVAVLATR